jgi:hypothetical protein
MGPFAHAPATDASQSSTEQALGGSPVIYEQPWEDTFIVGNHFVLPRLRELFHARRYPLLGTFWHFLSQQCQKAQSNSIMRYETNLAEHEFSRDSEEFKAKREALAEHEIAHAMVLGMAFDSIPSWIILADEIKCRKAHGIAQREGTSPELAELTLGAASTEGNYIMAGSEEVLQLGMVRLLNQVMGRMETATSAAPAAKMVLYSGHDTTIIPLIKALELPCDEHWPPFASHIILELLEPKASFLMPSASDTSGWDVRVWYTRISAVSTPLSSRLPTSAIHKLPPYIYIVYKGHKF